MSVSFGETVLATLQDVKHSPKQQRPRVKRTAGAPVAQIVRAQPETKLVLDAAVEDAELSRVLGKARRFAIHRASDVVRLNLFQIVPDEQDPTLWHHKETYIEAELRDLTRAEQWLWILQNFAADIELPGEPPEWWRRVWAE